MDRIQTLHPEEGKKGVNIERAKYDEVHAAILDALSQGPMALTTLFDKVSKRLPADFKGSPGWYTMSVKLDMEARGEIERVPKVSPQELRLKQNDQQ